MAFSNHLYYDLHNIEAVADNITWEVDWKGWNDDKYEK